MKTNDIKGIICPILTPMHEDESINVEGLRGEVDRLIDAGIYGIFCFGTNGENYALSEAEKIQVLEITIDQVAGRVPVYAGTGCITTADTIRLSRKAQELGADVLSVITPSFALASQEELYAHYVALGKQVDLPIVIYNIPARTGNKVLPETLAKLAKDVDVIVGAKDSSGDWGNLQSYIDLTKDLDKGFRILSGNDALILQCLEAGGAGGIAGCSNVYPRTLVDIYDRFIAEDVQGAQEAQEAIVPFRGVFKYGNPNTIIKKAAAMLGYPVGDLRRPFNGLSEEGVDALKAVLAENKKRGLA
jgi:4-hydroxy-tetrahydrodipicolinate synthase